jgi:glyceraldehyde-3-phosphate dehydrogenase/erythrose-4-phosphate dehydrogenase
MTTKVGVNGFGRIGHAFTRLALERTGLEVVNPVKPHHDSLGRVLAPRSVRNYECDFRPGTGLRRLRPGG